MTAIRSLGDFVVVPVTADPNPDRTVREPTAPEVGARWGNPAAFAFSAIGATESNGDRSGFNVKAADSDEEPIRRRVYTTGGITVSYKNVTFVEDLG